MTASVPGESNRGVLPRAGKAVFPRSARLLRHADFERVYKAGRRHFSASMTVFYLARGEKEASQTRSSSAAALSGEAPARPAGSDPLAGKKRPSPDKKVSGLRIGFTVGRALGGAVQRNRMKRRLREAVRLTRPRAGADAVGVDVVGPDLVNADVVINPKKSLLSIDFAEVVNEVRRAFVVIEQKLAGKMPAGREKNSESRKPGA